MNNSNLYLEKTGLEIAIVGMSGRFPGAIGIEEFWNNLCVGRESIRFFTEEEVLEAGVDPELVKNKNYVRARGIMGNIDKFDAGLFSVTPREAVALDPQQRQFLEVCWAALEDAGHDSHRYPGAIGVYGGSGFNSYLMLLLEAWPDFMSEQNVLNALIGNDKEYLATRVCYKLDLKGPGITVQTACSTSLVAVHLAVQGLIAGDCDMALAGGVTIRVPETTGYLHQKGSILSPDGHCRAFDKDAAGAVAGNGVGVVVLKRLEDAIEDGDHIYSVIKGIAINNDGSAKAGYTAPSVEGESRVIRAAHAMANIEPNTIGYIETHGTGTAIGDPIEINALNRVFRESTDKQKFCAIGSVKTNVGHLDAAAGVTGLIKTSLSIYHNRLVPSLNYNRPNPKMDFIDSPFEVNTECESWPETGYSRRAAVSSFGIGGTNAHVILEQAPEPEASSDSRPWQLISLSARSRQAVLQATHNLTKFLEQNRDANLADVAYTLHQGRRQFSHRRILVVKDTEDAIKTFKAEDPKRLFTSKTTNAERKITFMFSGQGAQYVNMGRELYDCEAHFQKIVDQCAEMLNDYLDCDIRDILYPGIENENTANQLINQTSMTQPALFVTEYALARLLISWGVEPNAMIGHSIGEYVAACLAGVISLSDALRLVVIRGRLMQNLEQGSMLSVCMTEENLRQILPPGLDVAAVNAPAAIVVSGPSRDVNDFHHNLIRQGVSCRELHTSHAFHSAMMDPALEEFLDEISQVSLNEPCIPYVSNLTGDWIGNDQATSPDYWVQHLRKTVRFADGVSLLADIPDQTLVEIGPGNTLSSLSRQTIGATTGTIVLNTMHHPNNRESAHAWLLNALGRLWASGVKVDWDAFYRTERRLRVSLPPYPFEHQSYWIDSDHKTAISHPQESAKFHSSMRDMSHQIEESRTEYTEPQNEVEKAITEIWQALLGFQQIGIHDNFFDLGGESMLAIQLSARIQETFDVELQFGEIFESPTVAEQAKRITSLTSGESSDKPGRVNPLVRIQPKGHKPIFFCVHPAGGIVHCYTELSRHIGKDQPFYALQHPGLDGPYDPYIEFDITAELYVNAIREVQPEGPYFIGGWSFGGTLAFEMAQQFKRQGQEVALLALIDSPGPDFINGESRRPAFDDTGIFTFLSKGVGGIFQNDVEINHAEFHDLSEDEKFDYILQTAGGINNSESVAVGREQLRRVIEMFKISDYAERNYGSSMYHGKITMLRVQSIDDYEYTGYKEHPELSNPSFGWDKLTSEEVDVRFVPGTHMTMVADPYVKSLAATLKECIDQAIESCQMEV